MQTVYVGLSGGVDSAVSAALLKERGYRVVGAFIKIWQPEFIECTWKEDRISALRVAAHLEIPFVEVDLSIPYRERVVDRMIESYRSGLTPNPDVLCNQEIKFGVFAQWAFSQGADLIATGHYARMRESNGAFHLHTGLDPKKDQSYFLALAPSTVLSRTLFPIGDLMKSEVRTLAHTYSLPNAKRPDSQGLCFAGDLDIGAFLSQTIEMHEGMVLNEAGAVIGLHPGASQFTLGERHGFTVRDKSAGPHYVIARDTSANTITVSESINAALVTQCNLGPFNAIGTISDASRLESVTRYHGPRIRGALSESNIGTVFEFETPTLAPSGQLLAVYEGDRCVGGALIAADAV